MRIITLGMAAALSIGATALHAQDAAKPALHPPLTISATDSARYLALGNKYTKWLLAGQADSIAAAMEPRTLSDLGGVERILQQTDLIAQRRGRQTKVVEEKLVRRNGRLMYWHSGLYENMPDDEFVVRWLLDEKGQITGAGLGPKSAAPPVDQ